MRLKTRSREPAGKLRGWNQPKLMRVGIKARGIDPSIVKQKTNTSRLVAETRSDVVLKLSAEECYNPEIWDETAKKPVVAVRKWADEMLSKETCVRKHDTFLDFGDEQGDNAKRAIVWFNSRVDLDVAALVLRNAGQNPSHG